jgi:hypothetical protein
VDIKTSNNYKYLSKNGKNILKMELSSQLLYELDIEPVKEEISYTFIKEAISMDVAHKRFGHISEKRLNCMEKSDATIGSKLKSTKILSKCETCLIAKSKYKTHKTQYPRQDHKLLDVITIDYKGPIKYKSITKYTGYLVMVDLYSSYGMVYGITQKSEILDKFMEFKSLMETQTNRKIKTVRTDQAREYVYGRFASYLKRSGIKQEYSSAYSQSSNGTAESRIRILTQMSKCLLTNGKLSTSFWFEAIECANYIYNRTICKKTLDKTPYELIYRRLKM